MPFSKKNSKYVQLIVTETKQYPLNHVRNNKFNNICHTQHNIINIKHNQIHFMLTKRMI